MKTIKEMRDKDQFFTKEEVSKRCILITEAYVNIMKPSLENLGWIEPSAGNGDFYFNFPTENRMAFDIERPKHIEDHGYVETNFLDVNFIRDDLIYVGNPPFGKRGNLAFDFIMKCIEMEASIISFILPPNINTKARMTKIQESGYSLTFHERLLDDSFYFDNGKKSATVAESVFQIYVRNDLVHLYNLKTIKTVNLKNNDFVQVYTINDNVIKNSNRDTDTEQFVQDGIGRKWIGKCDFYLPLRVFKSKGRIEWYDDFDDPDMSNIGFGIICQDKDIKNKIDLLKCYTIGTNNVSISKKQLILKEIMRVKDS